MSSETNVRLTNDEAVGVLASAVRLVRDVMAMIEGSLQRANVEAADKVFNARVEAQRQQDQRIGVQPTDEFTLLRLHPLQPLWRLALSASALLDRILSVTNPELFAARKRAELDVRKAFRQAEKLTTAAA